MQLTRTKLLATALTEFDALLDFAGEINMHDLLNITLFITTAESELFMSL